MPAVRGQIEYKPERMWRGSGRVFARLLWGGAAAVFISAGVAVAQTSSPAAPQQTAQAQSQSAPAIPPVTTTVLVHGDVKDDYLPDTMNAGTLDGARLSETPLSATIVTRDLLTDQGARVLADVVKNDASIGEDYAP